MRTGGNDQGEPSGPTPPRTADEVCGYVAEISRELASMARGAQLHLLAYFLDMAAHEAARGARDASAAARPILQADPEA